MDFVLTTDFVLTWMGAALFGAIGSASVMKLVALRGVRSDVHDIKNEVQSIRVNTEVVMAVAKVVEKVVHSEADVHHIHIGDSNSEIAVDHDTNGIKDGV
ncbi:MAG: hypothetical protein ACRD4B_09560 [Acidobacteriota bacterium]